MATTRNGNFQQEVSRAKFKLDNKNPKLLFRNPIHFVSIYNKHHQDKSLKATLALMYKKFEQDPDQFKTLDVLVSGTLERHNYWALAENITNTKLAKILRGLHVGSLEDLAAALAKKFLPLAKRSENKYIMDNMETFYSNMPDSKVNIILWEKMVPGIINDKNINHGNYNAYYALLEDKVRTDKTFSQAFKVTSDRLLQAKKGLILKQGQRIRSLVPAMAHLTDDDLMTLASICCHNFLMEGAPLLFARLCDLKYSSILYPAPMTDAFEVTKSLFSDKLAVPEWVVIQIIEVKKSEYADSKEAKIGLVPKLERSLSVGSLLVQTKSSYSLLQKIFFKPQPAVNKASVPEIKSDKSPANNESAEVVPFPHQLPDDPHTARTDTSETQPPQISVVFHDDQPTVVSPR